MICSLKFKKDVAILKMLLWILSFCFLSYAPSKLLAHFHYGLNSPWASYCSLFYATSATFLATSVVFLCIATNHSSLSLIDGYILVIHQIITHKAFAILSLTCSDLLNCLRTLGTMVITIKSGSSSLKVTILYCFDVCSVQPPKIFQVLAKVSTEQPVFPDYLSVSYDYDPTIHSVK